MKVKELIEKLKILDSNKMVVSQVIAEDGTAWNCWLEVNDIDGSSLVQIKLYHPELKTLPKNIGN
jgi:hypothetical protein